LNFFPNFGLGKISLRRVHRRRVSLTGDRRASDVDNTWRRRSTCMQPRVVNRSIGHRRSVQLCIQRDGRLGVMSSSRADHSALVMSSSGERGVQLSIQHDGRLGVISSHRADPPASVKSCSAERGVTPHCRTPNLRGRKIRKGHLTLHAF